MPSSESRLKEGEYKIQSRESWKRRWETLYCVLQANQESLKRCTDYVFRLLSCPNASSRILRSSWAIVG